MVSVTVGLYSFYLSNNEAKAVPRAIELYSILKSVRTGAFDAVRQDIIDMETVRTLLALEFSVQPHDFESTVAVARNILQRKDMTWDFSGI